MLKQIFNKQKQTQFLNETCYTRLLLSQNKSSLETKLTLQAGNHQVDALKCKIVQRRTFSAIKFLSLADSFFNMEKLLSTESDVG